MRSCGPAPLQPHGHKADCLEPAPFLASCQFHCDPGYVLPSTGVSLITCSVKTVGPREVMTWDEKPTACKGVQHSVRVAVYCRKRGAVVGQSVEVDYVSFCDFLTSLKQRCYMDHLFSILVLYIHFSFFFCITLFLLYTAFTRYCYICT